jgi:Leucine-rich repeat (LRR) protein
VLDLYQNELRNLNRHVGKLTQLTEIDLNYNHLTSLPKLKHLKQLTKVGLLVFFFSFFFFFVLFFRCFP